MRLPFAVCTSPSEECPKSMNEEKGFPTPSASNTEAHGSLQHSARRNCTVAVFDRCWSLLPAEAMESRILALAAVWMTLAAAVRASDPELTTDFAVPAGVDPATINSTFFTFIGFRGGVQAPNGTFGVKRAFEGAFPALHGLGVSIAIVEYFPGTTNPPHTHPRGTEVLYVLEGVLNVGLVDSTNKFFGQVLQAGDVFVFPKGLIHYQINLGKELVRAVASFSSSNPGTVQVGANLFASGVPDIALTTAFKVEKSIIDTLQAAFAPV